METIWTPHGAYHSAPYESEADLENTIVAVSTELFGEARHYLDVKRKIGTRAALANAPVCGHPLRQTRPGFRYRIRPHAEDPSDRALAQTT